MSRGVRILSRLQLPPDTLARVRGQSPAAAPQPARCRLLHRVQHPEDPHIALLCLDTLDLLGVDYEVMGGPANAAASTSSAKAISPTPGGSAIRRSTGSPRRAPRPCCRGARAAKSRSAKWLCRAMRARFGARPFDLNPFLVFLADHAETLAGLMKHRVDKRVALHERPVLPAVQAAVRKLLSIVPGVELVEIDVPRRRHPGETALAVLPDFKRELVAREARCGRRCRGDDIGDDLSCLPPRAVRRRRRAQLRGRQLHGNSRRGLGLRAEDLYKRLKLISDIDDIIVETSPLIAEHGLDLDTVRDALFQEFGAAGRGSPAPTLMLTRPIPSTGRRCRSSASAPGGLLTSAPMQRSGARCAKFCGCCSMPAAG